MKLEKKGVKDICYFSDDHPSKEYTEGEGEFVTEQKMWTHYTGPDGNFMGGTWECKAGTWIVNFTVDEHVTILEGEVTVIDENENSRTFKAGDTVLFPAGLKGRWVIDKFIRKHFTAYDYGKEFTPKGIADVVDIKDEAPKEHMKREGTVDQSITDHYTSEDGNFGFGLWDSHQGSWPVEFVRDEICEFTKGEVTITDTNGESVTFKAGDKAIFPAGFCGTWSVDDYIQKVFIAYSYPGATIAD